MQLLQFSLFNFQRLRVKIVITTNAINVIKIISS